MRRYQTVLRTASAMLAGGLLVLAAQAIGGYWSRPAQAADIDNLARSALVNLQETLKNPNSRQKIQGVAGLGDGRTFIVYTDSQIYFYQYNVPGVQQVGTSMPR
jgi:hypothetical protein